MLVVLCDLQTEGHHCVYLNLFAKAISELGHNVLILSPANEKMIFGAAHRNKNISFVQLTNVPQEPQMHGFFSTRRYVLSLWQYTATQLRAHDADIKKDLIFFPSVDEYITPYISLSILNRIFPFKWSGLYLKPKYIREKQSFSFFRKKMLNMHYLLRSRNCMGFGLLDYGVADYLQKITPGKPIYFLPDIIDETPPNLHFDLITEIRNRAGKRKLVLLIGAIDKRKNIINFIRAASIADPEKYFFIAAGIISTGKFSQQEIDYIIDEQKNPLNNNLFIYNKKIGTESQFNGLIASCDILFAAYLNFPYSSNMIGKAAFYKKPVIVSKGYVMADITQQYSLGKTVNPHDTEEIVRAIEALSGMDIRADNINRYNKDFSLLVFRRNLNGLIKKIQSRLG